MSLIIKFQRGLDALSIYSMCKMVQFNHENNNEFSNSLDSIRFTHSRVELMTWEIVYPMRNHRCTTLLHCLHLIFSGCLHLLGTGKSVLPYMEMNYYISRHTSFEFELKVGLTTSFLKITRVSRKKKKGVSRNWLRKSCSTQIGELLCVAPCEKVSTFRTSKCAMGRPTTRQHGAVLSSSIFFFRFS